MIQEKEAPTENRQENQVIPAARLGKYLRREVRSEFKRLAFQIKLLCLFEPAYEAELARFHALEPLNRFFETEYKPDFNSADSLLDASQLSARLKLGSGRRVRRPLKLMRRQLRKDLCRLVEKAQLLRALDPAFETEVRQLGWARPLDTIARWHASGGWEE